MTQKTSSKQVTLLLVFSITLLLFPGRSMAQYQWAEGGIHAASSASSQTHFRAIPDGLGGFFLTYEDNSTGDADIFAQWIDGSGKPHWNAAGVTVTSAGGDQKYPAIAPDGSGGIYIAWQDDVSDNIYGQHINANGALVWSVGGLLLCSAPGDQSNVEMVADGAGGFILVWIDKRNGSTTDIYAQRVRSTGFPDWTANGVAVTTATGNQSSHVILGDGGGGVFVVWQDYRGGYSNIDLYAQRLSASGDALWTADDVAVSSAQNNQISPVIDTTGNQLVIAWEDIRSGVSDIYAQALDTASGNPLWTVDGIPVSTANGSQLSPRLTHDGAHGTIVAWIDNRNLYDIYAQKLNSNGTAQWTANGIPINESEGYQVSPEIVPDDSGGAIVAWKDFRSGVEYGLYLQHVSTDASLLYNEDGLSVVASDVEANQDHLLLPDQSGGALAVWQDSRDGTGDIYAQHLNTNITIIEPLAGVLILGNETQTIRWRRRTNQTQFHHLTIRLSLSPGDGFPIVIAQDIDPALLSYDWLPDSVNSMTAAIRIQAHNSQDTVICEYNGPQFSVDSSPPEPFDLISPSDGLTVSFVPTFEWESTTDLVSGLDQYQLWIDDALVKDHMQGTTYTLPEEEKLSPGEYTWTVKAVDASGFVRQALHTWTLRASEDNTPPAPFHLLSPAQNTWTTEIQPTFTWEASSDTGKGLQEYQLFIDDQLHLANINPSATSTSDATLTAGNHTWYIIAVDSAQNKRVSEETWILRVDNLPPKAFTLNEPADNQWTIDTTPTFVWQASADSGIGLAKYQLWIDNELKVDNIAQDVTQFTLPQDLALTEGTHTWTVIAFDELDNSRAAQEAFTVGIDITPPDDFALTAPQDESHVSAVSPDFQWEASADGGSGLQEYELWIDGERNVDDLQTTTSPPAQPLIEGPHTWRVRALDYAGNVSTSATYSFVSDTTPPASFHLISPPEGTVIHTSRPTFIWHATEDAISDLQKYQLYVDGQILKDDISPQDTAITLSPLLENGEHKWKVRAVDLAGNGRFSEDYYSITIDCRAPQITSADTASATEDVSFTYTATATDPDGDDIDFVFSAYPAWLTPTGHQISGTPLEGATDTSFLVIATDGLYSDSLEITLTVRAVNDPPLISSADTAYATEDALFSYTAAAVDPEEDDLSFSFQDYPVWLTPSENRIEGMPDEDVQDTSFVVIASDGSLSDTLKVTVVIISVNDPPVITSPSSAVAKEDSQFVYRATAIDVDGPSLSIRFIDYPSWLSPSGSEISGIPTEGRLDTTFTIVASDLSATDTLVVYVTVIPVNDAPFFDYAFPEPRFYDTDTLDWELDLDDYASDPDHPDSELTWTYDVLGDHDVTVSIDEATHVASLFGIGIQGTLRIAFTVTDPLSASVSDTLTMNFLITDVDERPVSVVPDDFVIYANYPNPFNPTTTIRYGIPHTSHVTLSVYNMLGQEISVLVDDEETGGMYEVRWDASDMPSGIYFYRIQAGSWQKVRRMILMR